MKKDAKILILVESPNKCSTIKKILKDGGYTNATVLASAGHITEIKDGGSYWNTGIDPTHNFKINYSVMPSKKDIVEKLKAAVQSAEKVFICSDPDREGEAIAWHLKTQLKIPESKYARATFHEVTKPAVLAALDSPRKIDDNLVDAAKSRAAIDKMLGYRLTNIARDNIQARSVGRCQSAGLKLVVEREEEIRNFVPEKYFDLYLLFEKNKTKFKAKYTGTSKKEIKRLSTKEACDQIINDCKNKDFAICSIEKKEQKESPKPPFTTSTFQQEANKVYGMSIDTAMSCAQKLFEGISIMGSHTALITYIRTDDTSMSPEFAETLEKYVKAKYGKQYYAPVKKGTKTEGSQEAHECLRVINLDMTPKDLEDYISDKNLLKIYKLIWERTVMSSMAPAIISDTQYNIANGDHRFVMHSKEIIFDGYRKIHVDTEDEISKDEVVKEVFTEKEILQKTELKAEPKETTPPKRYTEATFIKELDKRGIGRPSTFATILKTILAENRGYCTLENKLITPTEKGMQLSAFLDKSFPDLINLHYTTELESDLDLIATGKKPYLDFLQEFYTKLEDSVKKVVPETKICPNCGKPLVRRKSKYGTFWGCSGYPSCKYIEK